jgi:hypothetical protein
VGTSIAAGTLLLLAACSYPLPSDAETRAVERVVQKRLGSVLETVSAEPVRFTGNRDDGGREIVGFKVTYSLRDCPASASNFTMEGEYYVKSFMMPAKADMSPLRFRDLLRQYAQRTWQPLGAVGRIETAQTGDSTVRIKGKVWPADQVWVIAPGYTDVDEITPYPPIREKGYTFLVPPSGPIRYLGLIQDSGLLTSDIGD